MDKIFFNDWESIYRTLIIGVLAYALLIVQLRISGKRTLSKMNAFDFIITVAFGSTLATILLSKDVALAEGMVALAVLIVLQFIITWLTVRFKSINSLVKSQPVLLVYQGNMLHEVMKAERINKDEIMAALRKKGIAHIEEVGAVVLETQGTLSIIKKIEGLKDNVLENVKKPSSLQG